MKIKQISIFLENTAGRAADVTGVLKTAGVNLRALMIRAEGTYPGALCRIKVCTRLQYFWRTNDTPNALRRGSFIFAVFPCVNSAVSSRYGSLCGL